MSRLRAVIGAKDEQIAALGMRLEAALAGLEAARDRERRLELRVAELERRLSMDSTDSGKGPQRDPDPGETKTADPPAECRSCQASLDGAEAAEAAEPRWAQVIDVEFIRKVTEWLLPGRACPCCGTVTFAAPPPGAYAGAVSCGPVLNAAAVLLSCYGNVPPERAAQVMGTLLGIPVSAGWVDKAAARVAAQPGKAGFDQAMLAALAGEDVLAADETPVNVLDKTVPPAAAPGERETDPEEKEGKEEAAAGAPHVLIIRTPDGRLTFLQAIGSRRKGAIAAGLPVLFTGYLITDGYTGYQHLLSRLAGIQQCAAHVIRRCRAVTKLGPGGVQNWAGDVITILREAHQAVEAARARGDTALDQQVLDDLLERYDTAVVLGDHPQPAPGLA